MHTFDPPLQGGFLNRGGGATSDSSARTARFRPPRGPVMQKNNIQFSNAWTPGRMRGIMVPMKSPGDSAGGAGDGAKALAVRMPELRHDGFVSHPPERL